MNNRRKFLRNAGSSALFASLGSSFFISCDEATDETSPNIPDDNTPDEGYTVEGNVYSIYLTHSSFSNLQSAGSFKMFNEGGMLLVNVGQNIIRAFSSSCPHQGCRTSWSYSNEKLVCSCHNAIFDNSGSIITGPGQTGDLTPYNSVLNDNILTVTK